METKGIIASIDAELAILHQVRSVLTGDSKSEKVGRPKKKRNLTPEGRQRIAEAVKRRWAAARKAAK